MEDRYAELTPKLISAGGFPCRGPQLSTYVVVMPTQTLACPYRVASATGSVRTTQELPDAVQKARPLVNTTAPSWPAGTTET